MQQQHVSRCIEQYEVNILEDDTMPKPADVETVFNKTEIDIDAAANWFADFDIDMNAVTRSCGKIGLINYAITWDRAAGRYRFGTFPAGGYRQRTALAVPVLEGGRFVDLLLIGAQSYTITTACGRAHWLGRDNLTAPVVWLHASPFDWLEAGCEGAAHIHPVSRQALKELRAARVIACNDVETALEAWDWAFGADDAELGRFEIDANPEAIRDYFEQQARISAIREIALWERERRRARA